VLYTVHVTSFSLGAGVFSGHGVDQITRWKDMAIQNST